MVGQLEGRVAIVTGAASGIGRGIAEIFVREGARVIVADISDAALSDAFGDVPAAQQLVLDVSATDAPARLREAAEMAGGLDILVNNAGIAGDLVPIYETTDEMWRRVMSVNLDPVFRITRECVPLLKSSRFGRIISTGSVCSNFAIPLVGAYTASKHAILGLMRSYAIELGQFGITANCLLPGNTVTGITQAFYPDPDTEQGKAFLAETNVLGRYSYPEDIASAALYLASDAGSYVTGQSIAIDGGMMARMPSLPV